MTRFLILASAASPQGSDAYTITEGHVCWSGGGKVVDRMGIVTAPDTFRVMSRLIESTVMLTVDQALIGRLCDCVICRSLNVELPEEMSET